VHIAPIRFEVDDWVPDELTGAVIRDVAAAARFDDVDSKTGQPLVRNEDVTSPSPGTHAKSQDVRVLEQEQHVADAFGFAVLDQTALQFERLGVRNSSEPAYFDRGRYTAP